MLRGMPSPSHATIPSLGVLLLPLPLRPGYRFPSLLRLSLSSLRRLAPILVLSRRPPCPCRTPRQTPARDAWVGMHICTGGMCVRVPSSAFVSSFALHTGMQTTRSSTSTTLLSVRVHVHPRACMFTYILVRPPGCSHRVLRIHTFSYIIVRIRTCSYNGAGDADGCRQSREAVYCLPTLDTVGGRSRGVGLVNGQQ